MARAIDAENAIKKLEDIGGHLIYEEDGKSFCITMDALIRFINNLPTIDTVKHGYVPIEVVRQIQWERDIAMSYLDEAGIGFGEKAELQRVKHGKWENGSTSVRTKCSNCEKEYLNTTIIEIRKCNFCPNCGARMDGE